MDRRDLLLSIVGASEQDEDFGRTSLQKISYFVGEALQRDLGHRPYHYGPFSERLEGDVSMLVDTGLVSERVEVMGRDSRGPKRRFHYGLTGEGRARLRALREECPEQVDRVQDVVRRLEKAAGGLHQDLLAQAAKTHFVASGTERSADRVLLEKLASSHGWKLREDAASRVESILSEIKHR